MIADARSQALLPELRSRADAVRGLFSTLPAVIPLRTPVAPPPMQRSIHHAPEYADADILTIDNVFHDRVIVATVEPQASGGWVFALRDFERADLRGGRAKRTVLVPLRHLPDLADAVAEALTRAAQLYGAETVETAP